VILLTLEGAAQRVEVLGSDGTLLDKYLSPSRENSSCHAD